MRSQARPRGAVRAKELPGSGNCRRRRTSICEEVPKTQAFRCEVMVLCKCHRAALSARPRRDQICRSENQRALIANLAAANHGCNTTCDTQAVCDNPGNSELLHHRFRPCSACVLPAGLEFARCRSYGYVHAQIVLMHTSGNRRFTNWPSLATGRSLVPQRVGRREHRADATARRRR
jgi:hypothetical protein